MLDSTIALLCVNVFFYKHTYGKGSVFVARSAYRVRNLLVNSNHSKSSKVLKRIKKTMEIKK